MLKRRRVVEKTFIWLMFHHRLARDHETLPASSEAMIHLVMIDNISKRITDETSSSRSNRARSPTSAPRRPK